MFVCQCECVCGVFVCACCTLACRSVCECVCVVCGRVCVLYLGVAGDYDEEGNEEENDQIEEDELLGCFLVFWRHNTRHHPI